MILVWCEECKHYHEQAGPCVEQGPKEEPPEEGLTLEQANTLYINLIFLQGRFAHD